MKDYEFYQIIQAVEIHYLTLDVNEFLSKGWLPAGGVFFDSNSGMYTQAVFHENVVDCAHCPDNGFVVATHG